MVVIFIRSIILYVAVLIALRIMGKGEIAEMNCFDLVITLLIAEVAAFPMENNDIPIINGVAAITGLVLMQTIVSFIGLKSKIFHSILSGKPSILIDKGKIQYKELKKDRINLEELLEQLRIEGYFNLKEIQYAILETDGNLSVVPTTNYNSTPSQAFLHLPISLIIDGVISKNGLQAAEKDEEWLMGILKSNHIEKPEDVLICILDEYDKIFIQAKHV
ncbi:MAG: DUF421 domain-containing protein [Clostridioides difficile]|nr:DUF421 domain-containing protein [Clostridioides sp.]MBS5788850.1 DUF421 domain-containing protein [Clostridioides difficile]